MEINYDRCNVSRRMRAEIINAKGESFWNELSKGLVIPSDEMESKQCSHCMRSFMEKLQRMVSAAEIKSILVNVRHDLQRDDFDWAVRLFNQTGNIDRFAIELQRTAIGEIISGYDKHDGYYGQTVSQEIIEYVQSVEEIFYGRRYGNEILAQAIPADVGGYLHPRDERHRRYSLCHCQFARESILQEQGPVSPLLCECSLGHTMILWETVLDRKLEGEVVESALKGSDRCLFRIRLPEDIVKRWT